MIPLIVLIGCFGLQSAWAITGDEVMKKFKLQMPIVKEGWGDLAACTAVRESISFYYDSLSGKLDSTPSVYFKSPGVAFKKSKRFFRKPTPTGYVETEILIDVASGDTLYKDVKSYNKKGQLLSTHSKSKMIREYHCSNRYDARGFNVEIICINAKGGPFSHQTFKYDAKGRKVSERNEYRAKGDETFYLYTDFDSVAADMERKKPGDSLPHRVYFYNKDKKCIKRIDFSWRKDFHPVLFWENKYNAKNQIEKEIVYQDSTQSSLHFKIDRFVVTAFHHYEYDEKGLLKSHVVRYRPRPDEK